MSLLTVKNLVYGYLKLDPTLAVAGSGDPSGYTQAQIITMINALYQRVAMESKCIEATESLVSSSTSEIQSLAFPVGYIDTQFIVPDATKGQLERITYMDMFTLAANETGFFATHGENIYLYDATKSASSTYTHFYWKVPSVLSADTDALLFPLSNWERMVALGAVTDLITYDTSQSAETKKNDFKVLFDEEINRFTNYWTNRLSANGGINSRARFMGG